MKKIVLIIALLVASNSFAAKNKSFFGIGVGSAGYSSSEITDSYTTSKITADNGTGKLITKEKGPSSSTFSVFGGFEYDKQREWEFAYEDYGTIDGYFQTSLLAGQKYDFKMDFSIFKAGLNHFFGDKEGNSFYGSYGAGLYLLKNSSDASNVQIANGDGFALYGGIGYQYDMGGDYKLRVDGKINYLMDYTFIGTTLSVVKTF